MKLRNKEELKEWAERWGAKQVVFYKMPASHKYRFVADLPRDFCPYKDFDEWDKELIDGAPYTIAELCGEEE